MNGKKRTKQNSKKVLRKSKNVERVASSLETNRLIAELVLGWRLHTHRALAGRFACNNKTTLDYWQDENGVDVVMVDAWFPTTNINDAWRVVEKLQNDYWLDLKSPFDAGEKWFAGFTPRGASGWNGVPDFSATGETAPLAICRAALAIFAGHEFFEERSSTAEK